MSLHRLLVRIQGSKRDVSSYDSISLIGRDMPALLNAASAVLDQSPPGSDPPFPKRLVYPIDMLDGEPRHELTAQFLRTLEVFTGIRADKVNVTATWAANPPSEAQQEDLSEYLKDVCRTPETDSLFELSHLIYFQGRFSFVLLRVLPRVRRLQGWLPGQVSWRTIHRSHGQIPVVRRQTWHLSKLQAHCALD